MSEDVFSNILRAGTPVAQNVVVQLDKMSSKEASFYQGADPHFTYEAFTVGLPISDPQLIRQDDQIVDQIIVDAITGTNRVFRIISSDPEPFMDGHWEWLCVRYRGT